LDQRMRYCFQGEGALDDICVGPEAIAGFTCAGLLGVSSAVVFSIWFGAPCRVPCFQHSFLQHGLAHRLHDLQIEGQGFKLAASHSLLHEDKKLSKLGICKVLGVKEDEIAAKIFEPSTQFTSGSAFDPCSFFNDATLTKLNEQQRRTLHDALCDNDRGEEQRALLLKPAVRAICNEVYSGGESDDIDCLHYILFKDCGSDPRKFPNSKYPMDCCESSSTSDHRVSREPWMIHPKRRVPDEQGGTRPMRFKDFVEHEKSRNLADENLVEAYVLALRMYTSVFYKRLNQPFYMQPDKKTYYNDKIPIPIHERGYRFPVTLFLICKALSRATAEDYGPTRTRHRSMASVASDTTPPLYRGVRSTKATKGFLEDGGTHVGPFSTTSNLAVAVKYALEPGQKDALLLQIIQDDFANRGVNLKYLSCFATEEEYLYPPLTLLEPRGQPETFPYLGAVYTILKVKPSFPST